MSQLETPRQQFLESVRRALGRSGVQPGPEYAALQARIDEQEQKVAAIRKRLASQQGQLLDKLEHFATRAGWQFVRTNADDEATRYILGLAQQHGVTTVAQAQHPVLQRLALNGPLHEAGLEAIAATGDGSAPLRERLQTAGIGITGVEYAIAETGSCVLLSRPGVSRLVSLLPPIYVAIVEAVQIVDNLDDFLAFRRLLYLQSGGDTESYMSLITGPSRTGDIEQVIVIGAHGPRQAHMVVLTGQ